MQAQFIQRVSSGVLNYTSLGTDNRTSFDLPPRVGGVKVGSIVKNLTGTSPTITVTIQQSADGPEVPDASATWETFHSFSAQAANGTITGTMVVPHFSRLRFVIVRGGTALTNADVEVVLQ